MNWETPQTVEAWLGLEREGLTALARGLVRSHADAEDCVQEASIAALRDPPETNTGAWLRTVVRRAAIRKSRDASRRRRREERAARPEGVASTADAAEHIEIRAQVLAAVQALGEPYRTTVFLRYFEGHRPAKIASLQGIPVKTVKTRLSRALAQMRASLDRTYGGRRSAWLPLMAAIGGMGRAAILLLLKKVAILGLLLLFAGGLVWWAIDSLESYRVAPSVETATRPGAPTLQGYPSQAPLVASAASVLHEGDPVPTQTFAGRVVDPDGRGVAGAHVEIVWAGMGPGLPESAMDAYLYLRREAERRERPTAVTDAEGYFRSDRPYGSSSYLHADAAGFVSQVAGPRASGTFALVRLATSGGTRIRILSEVGSPVPDAEVRLAAASGKAPWAAYQLLASARSDGEGRVALPSFTGTLSVQVVPVAPEHGTVERPLPSSEEEVEIRVPVTQVVEHRTVDAETGLPVAGAWVDLVHRTPSWGKEPRRRRVPADADGSVRFPLQNGFDALAGAPGYEMSDVWGYPIVALVRAMRVEGVVTDERGAPFAGAAIMVVAGRAEMFGPSYEGAYGRPPFPAWSDSAGRFGFDVALPYGRTKESSEGGLLLLAALHPEHAAGVADGIPIVPGDHKHVTLRFPRPSSLAIEVVDAAGRPVVGHRVGVQRRIDGANAWSASGVGFDTVVWARQRNLWTDKAGRVLADGLSPGPHFVRSDLRHVEVEVREGETQTVRIVKGDGPGIRGRVIDAKGTPQAGVEVLIGDRGGTFARTDPDGRFAFLDLPEQEYRLSVRLGFEIMPMLARAKPGDEVTLRFPSEPARLRIHVEGPPVGTARYSLYTVNAEMDPPYTGRGGSGEVRAFAPLPTDPFEIRPLRPGVGVLVVEAPGFGWTAVRFDVAEEGATDVAVSLRSSGSVVVRGPDRPLDAAGRWPVFRLTPTDGHLESVMGMSLADLRKPATDATRLAYAIHRTRGNGDYLEWQLSDGAFRFPEVTPGPYEASLGHYEVGSDGSASWVSLRSMRIEVRSGETTNVDL